ncbi:CYTH domain-containing protein [Bermanella sp. WJH001]|uniref:CYTH domain-containing protein n=1 Tax=Bermanella sp. WJH001 TaxID=3048005 RepID=UPI0024BEA17E|nr:CYTH domain-containing protein [Bermanella sp. WJH001]MDJ1538649.1 CYTH domain-containing protein [Bermanella sp. WJH001]
MAKEVELKLSLPSHGVANFIQDENLGLPQGAPLELDNQYFDTPDLALNQAHAALRVRKSQHGYKQTLKNKGQAIAGLHERGEWEYDIPSAQLDWSLFANDIQLDAALREQIQPIFKTDFSRHVWLKQFGESEIELVLDEGVIHNKFEPPAQSASSQSINLCEIELELKSGRVEDLFAFAKQLAQQHPLVPCDINKAERGYGLLFPKLSFFSPQNFAGAWANNELPTYAVLQEALTRLSRHWDQFSQQENWWSLLVMNRQVSAICLLLNELPHCPDHIRGRWLVLQLDLQKLLQPAAVVVGLYVDNNSHSRGLSQRLLSLSASQLSAGLETWMANNGLGMAMLELGEYLYAQAQQPDVNGAPWIQDLLTRVGQGQGVHESSLQALAYVLLRCQDDRYQAVNEVIRCQLVVNAMIAAQGIQQAITDETSRAKLASWQRRITVERRNLLDAKQALMTRLQVNA